MRVRRLRVALDDGRRGHILHAVGQHRWVRVAPDEGAELKDGDEARQVGHLVG